MPSTQPYAPNYDFASDPAPSSMVNAVALQTQFQLLSANLADLITALGVSIRDDNTLTDQLVRIRNLHPELQTLIDSIAEGTVTTQALLFKLPVAAASTANVASLFGTTTIDGIALVANDRVLLKNQTTASENGIWIIQTAAWTRATDLPVGLSGAGWAVCVRAGTLNGESVWAISAGSDTSTQPVVGTDALVFFPVFAYFPISIAHGGTGATTVLGARTNLGVPGKYVGTITGDGSTTVFTITHSLSSQNVVVSIRSASGQQEMADITAISGSQIQVTFVTAPANLEALTVTVIG